MKIRDVTVTDGVSGKEYTAQLSVCERCTSEAFRVYGVDGHLHLQCIDCDTTFCDHTCDAVTTASGH